MADTINTGTMLIEEGALMPESLRFESEPWTPFYMAGEVILELRKASGKQSKYGSEGNMARTHKVINHYDYPRDIGSLPTDDPHGGIGLLGAPECGDVMKLQMKINSETQVVVEADFKKFGCGSAIASSSLATEWVKGKTSRKRCHQEHEYRPRAQPSPRATLLDATRYSRIRRTLHLVSSPIF